MSDIQKLIEYNAKIDYPAVCENIIRRFGVQEKVNWNAVLPIQVQKDLFGVELLRNIVDMPKTVGLHEIRAINLLKGEITQLLFFFVKVRDNFFNKAQILTLTRKFLGGQAAQNYIIWFVANEQETEMKIVVVGKEQKKVKLKILPLEAQKWYKTNDYIFEEVHNRFATDGLFQGFVEPEKLWKAVWDSFDISIVNKHFYIGIYQYFKQIVVELNKCNDIFDKKNAKEQFAIRLLGRILFCWFLKKKDIVEKNILSSDAIVNHNNYYREILSVLFFDVFNKPKNERKKLNSIFTNLPYLNGGLFEPQIDDYYVDREGNPNLQLQLSNDMFVSLFQFLESYNFTIDENSSTNSEIAIDPEMLGRIFENLLAEQNPETGDTARKSTGSYYTPREIVDYMVEESLIEYLKTNLKNFWRFLNFSKDEKAFIEELVHTETLPETNTKDEENSKIKSQIFDALNKIKVLDPACGSGAFPIGMLQKIVALKKACDVAKTTPISMYYIKLETLQNSIYGIDIQPLATELSRLRCWLTLIVDEDAKDIKPLPNLDFKFITANALIDSGYDNFVNEIVEKSKALTLLRLDGEIQKLENIRHNYFQTKNTKDKQDLKDQFYRTQTYIKTEFQSLRKSYNIGSFLDVVDSWKPFDDNAASTFFSAGWMFGLKPETKNANTQNTEISLLNKQIESINVQIQAINLRIGANKIDKILKLQFVSANLQIEIIETQIEKIKSMVNSIFGKIDKKIDNVVSEPEDITYTSHALNKNIDELNKKIEALSSELKEPEKVDIGVFDIVIGNPPYIQLQKNKGILADMYAGQKLQSFARTGDLYCLFYEKGNMLLKNKGILALITSNKWMRAGYGEKLRTYFINNTNPLKLLDFGGFKVFESATVDTNILIFEKNKFEKQTLACHFKNDFKKNDNISDYFEKNSIITSNFTAENWVITDNKTDFIKQQIEKIGTPLKEWDIEIYRGVLTGYNEAFIIDGKTKDELISKDPKNAEIIKPILKGRDIKRYSSKYADLWLINSHNGLKSKNLKPIDVKNDYPTIYKHFENYLPQIQKRLDQGEHWTNLRNCAYLDEFNKAKIVYSEIVKEPQFLYDNSNFFVEATNFLMTGEDLKYLASLLNSKPVTYCFKLFYAGGGLGESGIRYKKAFLENIPIPKIPEKKQKSFEILCEYMLFIKSLKSEKINEKVSNDYIAQTFENVIDGCVCELYFADLMKGKKIDILQFVEKDLISIENIENPQDKAKIMNSVFEKWSERHNEIRNRVMLFSVESPDVLGVILYENKKFLKR